MSSASVKAGSVPEPAAAASPPSEAPADEAEVVSLLPQQPAAVVPPTRSAAITWLQRAARYASSSRTLQGIAQLCLVSVLWVCGGELTQHLYSKDGSRPFLITCLNNAEFGLLLAWRAYAERRYMPATNWKLAAAGAAKLGPLWLLGQCLYNSALSLTSVASVTLLSSLSSAFALLFSVLRGGRQRLVPAHAVAVLLTVAGAACVAYADRAGDADADAGAGADTHASQSAPNSSSSGTSIGDVLAVASAAAYGAYTVALSELMPEGSAASLTVYFGFVGLCSWAMVPLLAALHSYGLEDLTPAHLTAHASYIPLILLKGLLDTVLAQQLWASALQMTSPVVATVGLSLSIPMALVADLLVHGAVPSPMLLLSSGLVITGFGFSAKGDAATSRASSNSTSASGDGTTAAEPAATVPAATIELAAATSSASADDESESNS